MKTLQGTITSLKGTNTARVRVERSWQHPLYKKYVTRSKNYAAHYEGFALELGEEVQIQESRPISKTKHFVVVSRVSAAGVVTPLKAEVKPEVNVEKTEKVATAEKSATKVAVKTKAPKKAVKKAKKA